MSRQRQRKVFKRIKGAFGGACAYCGIQHTRDFPVLITRDHILALSKNGRFGYWNVLPACEECNQNKGAIHILGYILTSGLDIRRLIKRFRAAVRAQELYSFEARSTRRYCFDSWAAYLTRVANNLEFVLQIGEYDNGTRERVFRADQGTS